MRILPKIGKGVKQKVGQAFLPVIDESGQTDRGQAGKPVLLNNPSEFFEVIDETTMFTGL